MLAALKGIYLLMLRLDATLPDLAVGRLGRFACAAGYYFYIGSAFGAGGIAARLAYHERPVKPRPRWHIDYLRAHARLVESWSIGTGARIECCWAGALAGAPDMSVPIPGFGASDTDCASHLLYAARRPGPRLLTETLLECVAGAQAQSCTIEITSYEAS
jgi:Uri superfamily endonuclease